MFKNRKVVVPVLIILIVVYNLIVFVLQLPSTPLFWLSYGFGMCALLLQFGICSFTWDKMSKLKSKFLGIPILQIGFIYLVLQMLSTIIFIGLPFHIALFKIAFIIDVLLLAWCLISIIFVDSGIEYIETLDNKIKAKVSYIKSLQAGVEILGSKIDDLELKKQFENLADTIKYSDPMSDGSLIDIENNIEIKVMNLTEALKLKDINLSKSLITELEELFSVRNKKCKLLK